MQDKINDVVIIGAGCSGLTAAIYCGRAELKPIVFAGNIENKGGLLIKTSIVENYPGFPDGINGYDLMLNMENQAIKFGAMIIDKEIISIEKYSNYFKLIDSDNIIFLTKTVIVCTGSQPRKLNLENEDKFWSNGISSCAVCDGALFKNKKIIVVGGGDSSAEMAIFLTKFSNVTLIHRRNNFRASKIMQQRILNNPKIKIIYDSIITKLNGKNKLEEIECKNIITGKISNIPVDGLFYGLGLIPNTAIFKDIIETDNDGYIIRYHKKDGPYKTMTSQIGIFVGGDCTDKRYKQACTAAADGVKCALDVIDYLSEIKDNHDN